MGSNLFTSSSFTSKWTFEIWLWLDTWNWGLWLTQAEEIFYILFNVVKCFSQKGLKVVANKWLHNEVAGSLVVLYMTMVLFVYGVRIRAFYFWQLSICFKNPINGMNLWRVFSSIKSLHVINLSCQRAIIQNPMYKQINFKKKTCHPCLLLYINRLKKAEN